MHDTLIWDQSLGTGHDFGFQSSARVMESQHKSHNIFLNRSVTQGGYPLRVRLIMTVIYVLKIALCGDYFISIVYSCKPRPLSTCCSDIVDLNVIDTFVNLNNTFSLIDGVNFTFLKSANNDDY